jgi:hypothetical protein
MPHYFFDIKDGHRLVDPSGLNCKNDTAAIEKSKEAILFAILDAHVREMIRHVEAAIALGGQTLV